MENGDRTIEERFENICKEAEQIKKYIEVERDKTTLFMLGARHEGDTKRILSVLVGNYGESVRTMVEAMEDNQDFADFILECLVKYFASIEGFGGTIIKVKVSSGIKSILEDMKNASDIIDLNQN